jgi:phosphate-selective porin OprO and OprP
VHNLDWWRHTGNFHHYWNKGLHLESRNKSIRIKVGGKLAVDGGDISANQDLEAAFPDLEGSDIWLRKLELSLSGSLYDRVKFQFQVDLGNPSEIKDNWLDVGKIPIFGNIRLGHMKEPVSFEELTGFGNLSFMERSLPTEAFAPGRNLGILLHDTAVHERMTWAVGGFWETGSFDDLDNPKDRIENATGFNLTTRLTALPW